MLMLLAPLLLSSSVIMSFSVQPHAGQFNIVIYPFSVGAAINRRKSLVMMEQKLS